VPSAFAHYKQFEKSKIPETLSQKMLRQNGHFDCEMAHKKS